MRIGKYVVKDYCNLLPFRHFTGKAKYEGASQQRCVARYHFLAVYGERNDCPQEILQRDIDQATKHLQHGREGHAHGQPGAPA